VTLESVLYSIAGLATRCIEGDYLLVASLGLAARSVFYVVLLASE